MSVARWTFAGGVAIFAFAFGACAGKARGDAPQACAGGFAGGAATGGAGGSGGAVDAGGAGSAGTAGVGPNIGSCEPFCRSQADCCSDCTYPNHLDCVDRHCVSLGCTSDADCMRAEGPGSVCRALLGKPACVRPCQTDVDCPALASCSGKDDQGESFCGKLPGLIPPCYSNADCDGVSGPAGVCDPRTMQCGCSLDGQCPNGSVCVPF